MKLMLSPFLSQNLVAALTGDFPSSLTMNNVIFKIIFRIQKTTQDVTKYRYTRSKYVGPKKSSCKPAQIQFGSNLWVDVDADVDGASCLQAGTEII